MPKSGKHSMPISDKRSRIKQWEAYILWVHCEGVTQGVFYTLLSVVHILTGRPFM